MPTIDQTQCTGGPLATSSLGFACMRTAVIPMKFLCNFQTSIMEILFAQVYLMSDAKAAPRMPTMRTGARETFVSTIIWPHALL